MSAHLLGTVRDMAQEHGAERARPSAEVPQEYRAIFEAVTDGLVITDLAAGRIVEVNPAQCRMPMSGRYRLNALKRVCDLWRRALLADALDSQLPVHEAPVREAGLDGLHSRERLAA
jgi:PAS domain